MDKKILFLIGAVGIGIVIGVFGTYAISKESYSRQLDKLSADIRAGEDVNRALQSDNRALGTANRDARKLVEDLENRISRDYKRYEEQVGRIKESVGAVGKELAGSTGSIQDVIDGLRALEKIVEALP